MKEVLSMVYLLTYRYRVIWAEIIIIRLGLEGLSVFFRC